MSKNEKQLFHSLIHVILQLSLTLKIILFLVDMNKKNVFLIQQRVLYLHRDSLRFLFMKYSNTFITLDENRYLGSISLPV